MRKVEELESGSLKTIRLREKFNLLVEAVKALQRGENITVGGSLRKAQGRDGFSIEGPPVRPGTVICSLEKTSPINFKDTPVRVELAAPTGLLAGSCPEGVTATGGALDLVTNSPSITFNVPGRYKLVFSGDVSYAAACAQALNLSDVTARMRLKIAGNYEEATAAYKSLHSKLCATGLVRDVNMGTIEGEANINPESGTAGQVTFTGELGVAKVGTYNRWVGAKVTLYKEFPITVVPTENGPKILAGPPSDGVYPLADPKIDLYIDRSDIEPDPGVDPLTWFPAASTELTLHRATFHAEYLG